MTLRPAKRVLALAVMRWPTSLARSTARVPLCGALAALCALCGCRAIAGYDPAPSDAGARDQRLDRGDGPLRDVSSDASTNDTVDARVEPDVGLPSGVVLPLVADPFGADNEQVKTRFSFVFAYGGYLYLGPRGDGGGAVRLRPKQPNIIEPIDFEITLDEGSAFAESTNKAGENREWMPSIGYGGCAADTLACGPDNENGRSIFSVGSWAGQQWLVLAGGKSGGDLHYIYAARDDGNSGKHRFSWIDLSQLLGPQTKGVSAAHFDNRLYLGFPDTGGKRPYLVRLAATPPLPSQGQGGLDVDSAKPGVGANLNGDEIPALGDGNSASTVIIDAMITFNDRLYVFNNGGCARAATVVPEPFTKSGEWVDCSPSGSFGAGLTTTKSADLLPRDKAFPQVAMLGGLLYAARNSSGKGPQLLRCDPNADIGGIAKQCDPDEWTLIGSDFLDQPGGTPGVMVMLLTLNQQLYVGIEHPTVGLQIYRSTHANPTSRADFEGANGCSAALQAKDCAGLGGNGLQQVAGASAKIVRLYDAKVLELDNRRGIYLSVGDANDRVHVYRILE